MTLKKKEKLSSGQKWIFDVEASELPLPLSQAFLTQLSIENIEFKPSIAILENVREGKALNFYTVGIAFDSSSSYGKLCDIPAKNIDEVIRFLEKHILNQE